MLAIRRALFHAAERSGISPETTPPAWIKNGWRWHLVCQKPTCQASAQLRTPQKIASLTFWHVVCQKLSRKYSCKRRLPLEEIRRVTTETNQGVADHGRGRHRN